VALTPGTRLGPYEIVSALGAGGMGEVYKARDTRLDRVVAIKVLPDTLAANPQFRERFDREARAISQLTHPHICTLHDVGEEAGTAYLVMELLDGETLAARLEKGALPLDQALTIAIQIASALDKAHRAGITHRDLKPGNIMLTRSGAKLLDFGLAKTNAPTVADAGLSMLATTPPNLTVQGAILGTLQYMAPEQLQGGETDARTDIWAFGCISYEMLTATPPFQGPSQASLIAAILEREPRPLPQALPSTPARLWEVIRACLEKDPGDRWQSTRDLLRELRWIVRELAEPSRAAASSATVSWGRPVGRRSVLLTAVGVAAVAGIAVLWPWHAPAGPPARTGPPVIVLMDSPHPERVYDPETRKAGGTNADDLTDLLRDLPVVLLKENTSATWHRENQVLQENPALIVAHRSCFYDTTMFDPAKYGDVGHTGEFADLAHDKFDAFMGFIATASPQTAFVVYSRGSWVDEGERGNWVVSIEQRFPLLRGRVDAMKVPLDRATFRNPITGGEIRQRIVKMLKLDTSKS
jgi:serine/threonine protein kinase